MRGFDSYLGIKQQSTLLTPLVTTSFVAGDFLSFNNETLTGRQTIYEAQTIRKESMQRKQSSAVGTTEAGGGVEFTASNFVLNTLLPLIFHTKTGTTETPAGATYSLSDGGVLPASTVIVGFSGPEGAYVRRFLGMKVAQASFMARVNQMLTVSTQFAGIDMDLLDSTQGVTPVYPSGELEYGLLFTDAHVKLKGGNLATLIEIPVDNFMVDINHNIDTNKYRLGGRQRRSLQEGRTAVTGSFELDMAAKGIAGEALTITGAVHDPAFLERVARESKFASLEFTVVDTFNLVGVGPSTFKITLPSVRLEQPDFQVREAGVIAGTARFNAYDSITAVHAAKLTA